MRSSLGKISALVAAVLAVGGGIAFSSKAAQQKTLTIYSGREEKLIAPLIARAEKDLGMDIEVRYGDTAELAIALLEEGKKSRADVFFAQDAGALGALAKEKRTLPISSTLLNKVEPHFRSSAGQWIGISGRARVIDYNTKLVKASELPTSVAQLTNPKWRNKIGWAPSNGSFQSFITAMRLLEGDQKTLAWLKAMKANGTKDYAKNAAIVEAIGKGEISLGLVNNYYLYRFTKDNANFPVAHHYTRRDAGAMVNVAGLAVLNNTDQKSDADKFLAYMLTPKAQAYFAQETNEYPLVKGIQASQKQIPLSQLKPPKIDLSNLSDLQGTLALLQEAGVL